MTEDNGLRWLPPDRRIRLDNVTCPYCGANISMERTEEHVIAERLVPRGLLHRRAWNLILWACRLHNREKANLEDDISAVSMQPDVYGRYADDNPLLATEAIRKGRGSVSRRTGRPVRDSGETLTVTAAMAPGVVMTANMTAPPQLDQARVARLSQMQACAFFYYLTYNSEQRTGRFWRGPFMPINSAVRFDWGNVVMRAFMDAVAAWEPRLLAIAADGYFGAVIRKHPDALCWSWGFEWNKNVRIVGFFGDQAAACAVASSFPKLPIVPAGQTAMGPVAIHLDTPLSDDADRLFWFAEPSAA